MIVISDHGATPENEETLRMFSLIGRRLTRVEIRDGGKIYLEFDPHGSIMIEPIFSQSVFTSIKKTH